LKQYLYLIISLVLFIACEDEQEKDCRGSEGGTAVLDSCGVCDSDPTNDCIQDCLGEWGGEAQLDICGVCSGDNTSCTESIVCELNTSDYSDFMTITAVIEIDGEQSPVDTLFSFANESCRGFTSPLLQGNSYLYFLTVYGEPMHSDSLRFYYKNGEEDLLWVLEPELVFQAFESYGNPSDPFIFTKVLDD